jgi:sugar lactone lactonase YvrE
VVSIALSDLKPLTYTAELPKLNNVNRYKRITARLATFLIVAAVPAIQATPATGETFTVSTFSGKGGIGQFARPSGVAISPDGTVYVADTDSFKIKKIVGQTVSDFVVSSTPSRVYTDNSFCGVFVKTADEIFASDCRNFKVYKYNKSGTLLRTYTNTLDLPNCKNCYDWGGGLAVDKLGGVFLSDEHNHVIIRIDENSGESVVHVGQVGKNSSIDGSFNASTFNLPRGLTVDSKNNLYVADTWSSSVRKVDPSRVTSTIERGLGCLMGVAVDSNDDVFTVNERYCAPTIFKVGTGKIFEDTNALKAGTPGYAGKPAFSGSSGLSIERYGSNPTNNIYIADWANHSIKVFSKSGQLLRTIGSEDSWGVNYSEQTTPLFDSPLQVLPIDDGSYLVVDNHTIRHLNSNGAVQKVTPTPNSCWFSAGVAFTPDGTFFCTTGHKIYVRFTDGTWNTIGSDVQGRRDGNSTSAQFFRPEGLAIYNNEIYVADNGNLQIRKMTRIAGTKQFQVSTVLGTGVWTGAPDIQPRSKATFAGPTKITIDSLGNLYVADGGVDSIFKTSLVQENDVTRIATGLKDWPSSITVDKQNRVYVSTYGGTFFRIANNVMSKIGGIQGYGNQDGSFDKAAFSRPNGLSIDAKGDLLVADRDNNKIRKVSTGTTPGLNILSASSVGTYLKQAEVIQPVVQGMSKAQETALEEILIKNNDTGLIAKIYQSKDVAIPARSTAGLSLCEVKIEKQISFDWAYTALSSANGCGVRDYIVTYKGYITWPGKGIQPRVIYAAVDDGMHLKINNETVIDKWSDGGANSNYPFNKSATATLEGGKQYPIEIWYYAWTPPSNFKLYWSPISANQRDETRLVEPEVFSPKLQSTNESKPLVAKPTKPFEPKISINLNFINLTVSVPIGTKTALLFAPDFGVPKSKAISGQITDGKASFEISVNSKYAGKKGNLQIVSKNEVGESSPLNLPVTGPKVKSKPVAVKTLAPKPVTRAPEITCLKGATKRVFEGTACPPGYTKG